MLNFNITMLKSGIKMIFDWLCVEFYSTYLLSSYSVVSLLNMCQKTTCIWKGLYLQSLVGAQIYQYFKAQPGRERGRRTKKKKKKKSQTEPNRKQGQE